MKEEIHTVDSIDLNSFYDGNGRLVFKQYIFWDYISPDFVCQGWELLPKEGDNPILEKDNGYYRVMLKRGGFVQSKNYTKTWTMYDPERINRDVWPVDKRKIKSEN